MASSWINIATEAAVREFGYRHYRGIIVTRIAAKVLPWLAVPVAVLALGYVVVRWVAPAVSHAASAASIVGPALALLAVFTVLYGGGMWVWYRTQPRLPRWMRHRGITSVHLAVIGLVMSIGASLGTLPLWL